MTQGVIVSMPTCCIQSKECYNKIPKLLTHFMQSDTIKMIKIESYIKAKDQELQVADDELEKF